MSNLNENIVKANHDELLTFISEIVDSLSISFDTKVKENSTLMQNLKVELISSALGIALPSYYDFNHRDSGDTFLNEYYEINNLIQKNIITSIKAINLIIEKFYKDYKELVQLFGDLGDLQEIKLGEGDIHEGLSVSRIVTTNSVEIFFKPKSIDSSVLFESTIDFILKNIPQKNRSLSWKKCKRIVRKKYFWEERIENIKCETELEAKNYYYRSGILLAIFYIFNSYDMHYDNIIGHGEYPILIDLETISNNFNQELKKESSQYSDLRYSVLNTSFIPWINSKGVFDLNMSGIMSRTMESDGQNVNSFSMDKDGNVIHELLKAGIEVKNDQRILNDGTELDYQSIQKELIDGFTQGISSIIQNSKEFMTLISSFAKENHPLLVRQLLRPTQVYNEFLLSRYHPSVLSGKKTYDDVLDILYNNYSPGDFGFYRLELEIDDLLKGNIPIFFGNFFDNHLYKNSEIVINNYYKTSPFQMLQNKLNLLNKKTIDMQKELIKLSMGTVVESSSFGETTLNLNDFEKYQMEEVEKLIESFLDEKTNLLIETNSNALTFLYHKMNYKNEDGDFSIGLEVLDQDFYAISPVILLYLNYGKFKKESKYLDIAKKLYKGMNQSNDDVIFDSLFSNSSNTRAFLAVNLYLTLRDEKYLDDFNMLIEQSLIMAFDDHYKLNLDFINGISSIIVFLNSYEQYLNKKNHNLYLHVINRLVRVLIDTQLVIPKDMGFGHGLSGFIWMILSFKGQISSFDMADLIEKYVIPYVLKLHNLINTNCMKEVSNLSWCRGLTGIYRVCFQIEVENILEEESSNVLKYIIRYLEDTIKEMWYSQKNMNLCHGILGNLMLLKGTVLYDDLNRKIPRLSSITEDIDWFDGNKGIGFDHFMLGNYGVAYGLLSLLDNHLPNILTMSGERYYETS